MKFKRAEDYEHLIEALRSRLAGYEKRLEDQQGMRRSLRESQDRYRTVFENSGTAIIVMARDTTITMANSGFERLTGLRKTDVQGRMRLDQIIYAADRQKMLHYQNRRSDPSEGPRMLDCHIQDERGQIRNVLLKIDDIPGTDESVGSMVDITALKPAEHEVGEQKAQMGRPATPPDLSDMEPIWSPGCRAVACAFKDADMASSAPSTSTTSPQVFILHLL